ASTPWITPSRTAKRAAVRAWCVASRTTSGATSVRSETRSRRSASAASSSTPPAPAAGSASSSPPESSSPAASGSMPCASRAPPRLLVVRIARGGARRIRVPGVLRPPRVSRELENPRVGEARVGADPVVLLEQVDEAALRHDVGRDREPRREGDLVDAARVLGLEHRRVEPALLDPERAEAVRLGEARGETGGAPRDPGGPT